MKIILVLAVSVGIVHGFVEKEYQISFTNWMRTFQKSYHNDEFLTKYGQFKWNMEYIDRVNKEQTHMTLALNSFADLSAVEFSKIYNGISKNVNMEEFKSKVQISAPKSLPTEWDWRSEGAVTEVKNQQQCGSCWSFSTTGSIEGCRQIHNLGLVSLSEQNLMDCTDSYGNLGCQGGLMTQAMQYIINNGGIDTEASYPYTAQFGYCQYNPAYSGGTLISYVNVNPGDEADLLSKVASGPTSVAIDASQPSFQLYRSGVYLEPYCSSSQLDHGVLVVGWGYDYSSGMDYWLVKNSYGPDWGSGGYIWMARNNNNMCGIASMATLPLC